MATATLIKENISLGGLQFQKFSPLSSWWNLVAHRQTWCWRRNWKFYMLIQRQQEVNWDAEPGLGINETSKPASTMTLWHFFQQDHANAKKAIPPNSVTPYELMGAITFKLPHPSPCGEQMENNGAVGQFVGTCWIQVYHQARAASILARLSSFSDRCEQM